MCVHSRGQGREEISGTFPLVGVSPIGLVKLPNVENSSTELTDLESHHTHFFLVPGDQWGDESPWLARIASQIAGDYPSVTVLINGGSIALVDAIENLKVHRPLVVIESSGRLADEIAEAVNHPEQEIRREVANLTEIGEITLFDLEDSFDQFKEIFKKKIFTVMNDLLESVEVTQIQSSSVLNEILLADIWRAFVIYDRSAINAQKRFLFLRLWILRLSVVLTCVAVFHSQFPNILVINTSFLVQLIPDFPKTINILQIFVILIPISVSILLAGSVILSTVIDCEFQKKEII